TAVCHVPKDWVCPEFLVDILQQRLDLQTLGRQVLTVLRRIGTIFLPCYRSVHRLTVQLGARPIHNCSTVVWGDGTSFQGAPSANTYWRPEFWRTPGCGGGLHTFVGSGRNACNCSRNISGKSAGFPYPKRSHGR